MSLISSAARRLAAWIPLAAFVLIAPLEAATPGKKAAARRSPVAAAPLIPGMDRPGPGPWLYRGSDVPQDKEWVFGELPNGLRYAVRRNGVPPGQVSVRIRIDAGSMYESESERGYAHLLEHLVFRESKYIGNAEAIPTWQRLGATFGSDTNAETTPTATVFKLDLPEATLTGLDESFKLLSGMMIYPALSTANLKVELPIVLAEKRERGGAEARIQDAMRSTLYAGQLLGDRDPIGTDATLNAATEASVRAFHDKWYRPENAVIVVAGDADPAVLAGLVKKWFSDWPTKGPHLPAPSFGDPLAPAGAAIPGGLPPLGAIKVLTEPDLPPSVTWAILRPWRPVNDTIVYNQGLMVDAIAQAIINRRLEARARAGGSYLVAQVAQQDTSRSADGTYVFLTPLGDNWQAAVKDVRAVIADAMAKPPTREEIDREVAEIRINFASSAEQRSLLPGSKVADDLMQAVDIRETVAAPDKVLEIFDSSKPMFTPAAVLKHTRALFAGAVTRAMMTVPKPGLATEAGFRAELAAPVAGDNSSRLAYKPISFASLPPIGMPDKPETIASTGVLAIEQVNFSNGVKALIWPSADEPGRVTVKVRFGAGYRAFGPDDAPYIALGQSALVMSGLGSLGQEDLDRISTGRKMGFDFAVDDTDFTFSANTRREDLADQLYLFAAKFAMPRWDPNPVIRAKASARLQYDAFSASPQGVLERDLKWLQHDRDPRYRSPTPQDMESTTPEKFRAVWEPILAQGPIEVQVFGDIDREATLTALSKTFGALKPRPPLPAAALSPTVKVPAGGSAPIVLTHRGDANQAAAMVFWPTGGGMADVRESRQLRILADVFSNRLLDRMREKLGASYSPQVYSSWPQDLSNGGMVMALAQVDPKDVTAFYAAADEIAADLIKNPPTPDELARVTEPLKQQISRASTGSAYFMFQLEGATSDPSKFAALRTLMPDLTVTSPEAMQHLAAKYLQKAQSWRLAVIPQGKTLTDYMVPPGGGAAPGIAAPSGR